MTLTYLSLNPDISDYAPDNVRDSLLDDSIYKPSHSDGFRR